MALSHRTAQSLQMTFSSPGCHLCESEVPRTPSGLINLPEAHRTQQNVLLFYRFIIKWYNSGTARWKLCIRQGALEKKSSVLSVMHHSPQTHHAHQPRRPRNLWVSTMAPLHRHDWLNHWPPRTELNHQPLSLPRNRRVELKALSSSHGGSPWRPTAVLGWDLKVTLLA